MRILLNCCTHASGDITCLTAVVRDLKATYPEARIVCNTTNMECWQNNPHILYERWNIYTRGVIQTEIGYDRTKDPGQHLIEYLRRNVERQIGLEIDRGPNHGELFLSQEEMERPRPVMQPYWVLMAGGKKEISVKWYPYYQEIVDGMRGKVHFVQAGASNGKDKYEHVHRPLEGVTSMVGQTGIRDFLLLLYHAQGVVSPITFALHAYAALPINPEQKKRGIVICGAAEEQWLTHYPHATYLQNIGSLPCCKSGACWKTRVQAENTLEKKRCTDRTEMHGQTFARCMTMIDPEIVCQAITEQQEN